MIEPLTLVLAVIIILCLLAIFGVQKTSAKCGFVFANPSPMILRQHMPGYKKPYIIKKEESDNTENMNDRINERFMHSPYDKRGNGPGNGMSDVTSTMWLSTGSQAGKTNDGRVINDGSSTQDTISPEYVSKKMDKLTDLMGSNMTRSRVSDYQHEMS